MIMAFHYLPRSKTANPEIVDPRNQRQPSNLRGLEGTSPWSGRGHGSPLSRRDCRPGSLLFPHHALLRDEFRKVQLDEPHLLDRQRLAFCECTNARCFSGVVVDASNVRCWQILLQKSFCEVGLKFSDPQVPRLNNDVGDHVAKRKTHRRFW